MTFRFAARYGLFTYAQCGDLDPFAVVDHFASLRSECIIGRENHADGGIHLHAFAMWKERFETRDVRRFDVQGCHPNVVAGYGTPEKGWDYATKDGEIVAGGLERPGSDTVDNTGSKWSEIVAAETADEFWATVTRLDPRALCCSYVSLAKYAENRYKPNPTEYGTPEGITFDTGELVRLPQWVDTNLGGDRVGKLSYTYARVLAHARGFTPRPRVQPARQEPGLWCAGS